MRISDWSSDVCSSDLQAAGREQRAQPGALAHHRPDAQCRRLVQGIRRQAGREILSEARGADADLVGHPQSAGAGMAVRRPRTVSTTSDSAAPVMTNRAGKPPRTDIMRMPRTEEHKSE